MHPYIDKPDKAFWNKTVSTTHFSEFYSLFDEIPGFTTRKIATGGSCFAQHIGHNLRLRKLNYLDMEPPPAFLSEKVAASLGYGVYSCRYGNIYTSRQLLQLFEEAFEGRVPDEPIWQKDGRYYDALRPSIEPGGFATAEEVRVFRAQHLRAVREMFLSLEMFVFTMGLTECWAAKSDGSVYPVAPGVVAGRYDPERYEFINLSFGVVKKDMQVFFQKLRKVNPAAQMILTVSPVPLAATFTNQHVLSATTYSKSILRAVAGEISLTNRNIFYVPSYEMITGQHAQHALYKPDRREVSDFGVGEVMRLLFAANPVENAGDSPDVTPEDPSQAFGYEQCDDGLLAKDSK